MNCCWTGTKIPALPTPLRRTGKPRQHHLRGELQGGASEGIFRWVRPSMLYDTARMEKWKKGCAVCERAILFLLNRIGTSS